MVSLVPAVSYLRLCLFSFVPRASFPRVSAVYSAHFVEVRFWFLADFPGPTVDGHCGPEVHQDDFLPVELLVATTRAGWAVLQLDVRCAPAAIREDDSLPAGLLVATTGAGWAVLPVQVRYASEVRADDFLPPELLVAMAQAAAPDERQADFPAASWLVD